MSLRPEPIEPVPEETARIARLAFPHGSIWLRLRDELGTIYEDDAFAPTSGSTLAAGVSQRPAVRGGAVRSAGGRGCSRPTRLEVPAGFGTG